MSEDIKQNKAAADHLGIEEKKLQMRRVSLMI